MSVLVESSVRAVLIAAAVAAIVRACRIRDPRARHAAACAVLAAMLLLPALTAWAPKAPVPVLPAAGVIVPAVELPLPPIVDTPSPAARPAEHAAASAPPPDLLPIAWLSVAGLLVLRLAYGAVRVASIRRHARRENGFLSSDHCSCPITAGWWKPDVVLPATWRDWPRAELDAVLAHERAHVRRRDPLVQWLAALNRCVFWFHPLAWWLERRLAALAEEACDAAAIASGHDPHDYSEYLIRQARAVGASGARIAIPGAAIGGGDLARRIRVLLDPRPAPALTRRRAALAAALTVTAVASISACRLAEKPAAGQPTMHELAERRHASTREHMERQAERMKRAQSLTPDQARELTATLQQNPDDMDAYSTLLLHYQHTGNVRDLNALKLWHIEHRPAGKMWVDIDPHYDLPAYEKGKALWLAHLKKPNAQPEVYQRAADFLEGGDKPLAEAALEQARKAHPGEQRRWTEALARH